MDKMGREAIISIGSNVPDKRERVEKACEELKNPSLKGTPFYGISSDTRKKRYLRLSNSTSTWRMSLSRISSRKAGK